MPSEDDGKLALILWRLDQIESHTDAAGRWHRQIMAGLIVALSLPIIQAIITAVRLSEGAA